MPDLTQMRWLPAGKVGAICFTVDDIHPARSTDLYEAGGDLDAGALGHLQWLLSRHPELRATLFVTPDWREISPVPRRWLASRTPFLRDRLYLGGLRPKGQMRLDRHPAFVAFLRSLERTDVALHGLHHVHRGRRIAIEFQEQDEKTCRRMLNEAMAIFQAAGLPFSPGMTPPGFEAPEALRRAMAQVGLTFISSARDIRTEIRKGAKACMSGLQGVSLVGPELLPEGLVHIPVNFQATSVAERAHAIIACGGVLSIKAHIIKDCMGFLAKDGLDQLYANYLDQLFADLARRWGERLWWTSMAEIDMAVRTALNPSLIGASA